MDGARTTDDPPASNGGAAKTTAPVCGPNEPCAEPFAIAEVAFEVDPFEKRPGVALPVDARLEIGTRYGSVGQGPDAKSLAPHYASISYAGDIDTFDHDIAAPLRAAVKMPPQTWLAFERKTDMRTHATQYESVVLRKPLLITSADVASVRVVEQSKTEIDLNKTPAQNQANEHTKSAVEVTLADASAARLTAWTEKRPEYPLAILVHGRVIELGRMGGHSKELVLGFGWLEPKDARTAAEKVAKEIQERAGRK